MKRFLFAIGTIFFSIHSHAQVFEAGLSGGMGGSEFRDSAHTSIQSVTLCGSSLVDSIKVTYVDGTGVKRGGNGGSCSTLHLRGSGTFYPSRLVLVSGCYNGNTINSLTLKDSNGVTITKGECHGMPFRYATDDVIGFKGRSASLLDAIGVISATKFTGDAGPSGSIGGNNDFRILGPINYIEVCSGSKIDSITVISGERIGGNGGTCQQLNINSFPFVSGNYITEIAGQYNNNGLVNLRISTFYGQSLHAGLQTGIENFSYKFKNSGDFFGFYGRSGSRIDSLGVIYFTPPFLF